VTGPELERETFRDWRDGRELFPEWPEPKPAPRLEAGDDHRPPLDDPSDARWLEPDDPRRREVERRRSGES
jgi:hypothetical protein